MDFLTVEVWTARGLVTHYVLFAVDLATRAVEIAGVTTNPDAPFMARIARNLTDNLQGFLRNKQFVVLDRDCKFTAQFRATLEAAGVAPVLTAVRAPNMNAFAERFVRSIQDECLSKMIFVGECMLHRALREFVAHYHEERNHEGVGNRLLRPRGADLGGDGPLFLGHHGIEVSDRSIVLLDRAWPGARVLVQRDRRLLLQKEAIQIRHKSGSER